MVRVLHKKCAIREPSPRAAQRLQMSQNIRILQLPESLPPEFAPKHDPALGRDQNRSLRNLKLYGFGQRTTEQKSLVGFHALTVSDWLQVRSLCAAKVAARFACNRCHRRWPGSIDALCESCSFSFILRCVERFVRVPAKTTSFFIIGSKYRIKMRSLFHTVLINH